MPVKPTWIKKLLKYQIGVPSGRG